MKNQIIVTCLAIGGLLALAVGCGKTENAGPSTQAADKTSVAVKAEPTQMAEKLVAQTTNAVATTTDAAKTTLDTAAKAADTSVNVAAPKVVEAANPAADKTQGLVGQTSTTLAGLSQNQMVQGLQDALAKG